MAITEAQAWTQIKLIAKALDERDLYLSTNSEKLIDHLNDVKSNLKGNASSKIESWSSGFLNTAQSGMSPGDVRRAFTGALEDFCQAINKPVGTYKENLIVLFDRMTSESDTINSNGPTYGSVSAGGSNVGNGLLYRLTVDEDDNPLGGNTKEAKTFYCLSDENSNAEYREVFGVEGENRRDDWAQYTGSGLKKETPAITAISAQDSENFINNPGWNISGTQPAASTPAAPATTTSITNWTVSATANFEVDIDTVYRGAPNVTTPKSLRIKDNGNIEQVINAARATSFPKETPLFRRVAVYRESNCDGTLTFEFGADTKATTMTSLTNGAWNIVTMAFDANAYYKAYRENDLNIKFTLASRTTGTLLLSPVEIAAWTPIDGTYYVAAGGSTSWIEDDSYSFTDSESARAILLYWLIERSQAANIVGRPFTLPMDNSGTETISDPT